MRNHYRAIKPSFLVILVTFSVLVISCTTAMYSKPFLSDPSNPNQYTFKIYVGGFSGGGTADKRAEKEITKFMSKKGYSSYEIVNRRYNFFPSYFEYLVLFKR